MRTRSLPIAALSLCLTGASLHPVSADATADARKTIQANLDKMTAVLNNKNVKGYTQFYADDFVDIPYQGKRENKQQAIAAMNYLIKQMKSVNFTIKIEKFALQKDKAVVTAREGGVMISSDSPNALFTKLKGYYSVVFTWVRSKGEWRIKQRKEGEMKTNVDDETTPKR